MFPSLLSQAFPHTHNICFGPQRCISIWICFVPSSLPAPLPGLVQAATTSKLPGAAGLTMEVRGSYRRDKLLLQLQPSAPCAAVSPHLGPATYLPIWNTTPLKLESRVDICLLCSVSKPRDLFLLPPSLPLFCLRRVLCICSFLGCISLCYLQCSVEGHKLMMLALMLTAVWSAWSKAPHSLQSLPEKLDLWAHSALPQQGSCCCLSSLVKRALAAEAEGTACRVSWVAITWSLLMFYVLSITQQEKCRSCQEP